MGRTADGHGCVTVSKIERQHRQGLGIEYRRRGELTDPKRDGLRLRDDLVDHHATARLAVLDTRAKRKDRRDLDAVEIQKEPPAICPAGFRILPEFGLGEDDSRRGLGTRITQCRGLQLTHAQDLPQHEPHGTLIHRLERNSRRGLVFAGAQRRPIVELHGAVGEPCRGKPACLDSSEPESSRTGLPGFCLARRGPHLAKAEFPFRGLGTQPERGFSSSPVRDLERVLGQRPRPHPQDHDREGHGGYPRTYGLSRGPLAVLHDDQGERDREHHQQQRHARGGTRCRADGRDVQCVVVDASRISTANMMLMSRATETSRPPTTSANRARLLVVADSAVRARSQSAWNRAV